MPSIEQTSSFSPSIPLATMPLVSPNALLHAHLKQARPLRPSNRTTAEARPIQLNVGSLTHCNGSSVIRIGATTIVCGIRAEILPVGEIPSYRVTKSSDRDRESTKQEGHEQNGDEDEEGNYSPIQLYNLLVPNLELSTGCSPSHPANTAPSIEAQSLSQRLLSLLHTTRLVRASDLEITYNPPPENQEDSELGISASPQLKAYWTIYIDMLCISHGGSLFGAAWMAMYAALKDALVPRAWWDMDSEEILCSPHVDDAKRLNLRGLPVPSNFGIFVPEKRTLDIETIKTGEKDEFWILMDTDAFEEQVCSETGCITVDCIAGETEDMSIVRIEKSGGPVVDVEKLTQIAEFAKVRWKQWKTVLDRVMSEAAAGVSARPK